ncbi:MAG: hypothetical protein AAFP90_17115 [Planctomycetota bacterium]
MGDVTELLYDARGHLISTLYDDRTTQQTVYGTAGNSKWLPEKTIDRSGVVSTFSYNANGIMIQRVTATARIDANGNEIPTPEIASTTTMMYLDGTSLPIRVTVDGSRTSYLHDGYGRRIKTTRFVDSDTQLTSTSTYVDNRLFETTDSQGRGTFYGYDTDTGRLLRTVPNSIREMNAPIDNAAVLSLIRPSGANATYAVTDYQYDEPGNQTSVTDPMNVVSSTPQSWKPTTTTSLHWIIRSTPRPCESRPRAMTVAADPPSRRPGSLLVMWSISKTRPSRAWAESPQATVLPPSFSIAMN